MRFILTKIAQQYIYIVLFGASFMIFGYYAPRVYARFVEYYRVTQPVSVDRKLYNPCDTLTFTTKRTAETNLAIHITHQLVRLENNNVMHKGFSIVRDGVAPEGVNIVTGRFPIPCNVQSGNYVILSTVNYTVEGVEKTYFSTSEQFNIVDEPIPKVE